MRVLLSAVFTLVVAMAFATAPALADSQQSSNWSGYAVHGRGVHFRSVSGQWRVPAVSCTSSGPSYSAMWVGLGGFSAGSPALEQTGTESDCGQHGRPVYTAWYELVPAPSRAVSMTVHPGDLMRATLSVSGKRVHLTLSDLTRHRNFARTVTVSKVDTTSAEWILEAPGVCSHSTCVTLPLADFGQAAFSAARTTSTSGHAGTIAASRWHTTRITLTRDANRRFIDGGAPVNAAEATPGALTHQGSAFEVRYSGAPAPSSGLTAAAVASLSLRH